MLQHPFATVKTGRLSVVHYAGPGTTLNSAASKKISYNPNIAVHLKTRFRPGTRILFWAANPQEKVGRTLCGERRAFHGFGNSGTVVVGGDGWIVCPLATPRPYSLREPTGRVAGRHLYLRRESYSRPGKMTDTLYAASCLPALTPCRRVLPIRGAPKRQLSVFLRDPEACPAGGVCVASLMEVREAARQGEVNLFLISS